MMDLLWSLTKIGHRRFWAFMAVQCQCGSCYSVMVQ